MAAGLTMLKILDETPDFYQILEEKSSRLQAGLEKAIAETGVKAIVNRVGSMFTLFFTEKSEVNSFDDVMTCDTARFTKFFKMSLDSGIYLAPSQFEAGFVSFAHTDEDIDKTVAAAKEAMAKL
jgi:glutamate-1-semialdehyde 2,1-aminomutase